MKKHETMFVDSILVSEACANIFAYFPESTDKTHPTENS